MSLAMGDIGRGPESMRFVYSAESLCSLLPAYSLEAGLGQDIIEDHAVSHRFAGETRLQSLVLLYRGLPRGW